jgi:hypothetical protein
VPKSPREYVLDLGALRAGMVASMQANRAWDGFKRTLSDVYPDEAHFIYELLQNAEDAQATSVSFRLSADQLVFSHNGKRPFSEADIWSITNMGDSTKRGDVNQIGKFGVGFKAVFAYTKSPRVASGDFTFEINDLFVPKWMDSVVSLPGETQFILPFNGSKSCVQCYQEVRDWLTKIRDNTLLFLRHISHLSWEIDGSGDGYLTRGEPVSGIVSIEHRSTGKNESHKTYWLRAVKPLGNGNPQFVSLAFQLEFEGTRRVLDPALPIGEQMKVVPVRSGGQLSIFFPAEKETIKLRFHIHGPYAAPIDRASIRHTNENQDLLCLTAQLLSETLDLVRDLQLLTVGFLEVLPNPDDGLAPFYEPLFAKIVDAMKERSLVPVDGGGHAAANDLLMGPAPIRAVIDNSLLPFYTGLVDVKWTAGAMQGQRASKFLKALKIEEWAWKDLLERSDRLFAERFNLKTSQNWLAARDDDWLQRFYALLKDLLVVHYSWEMGFGVLNSQNACKTWQIVRTSDRQIRIGREAFFAADANFEDDVEFPTVAPEILAGNKKVQIESAKRFLELSGVRVLGEKERIETILRLRYSVDAPFPDWGTHVAHLQRFIASWEQSKDAKMYGDAFIFLDETQKSKLKPAQCYLDEPFLDSGLKGLLASPCWVGDRLHLVAADYSKLKIGRFREFSAAVGVIASIPIVATSTRGNPSVSIVRAASSGSRETAHCVDEDYALGALKFPISNRNASRAIWISVAGANPKVLKARYRPNAQFGIREGDSQLVCALRDAAWVPTKSGKFEKPALTSRDELPGDFPFDDRNGWLRAVGFGTGRDRAPQEEKVIENAAKALGISADTAGQFDELTLAERLEVERGMRESIARVKSRRTEKTALNPTSTADITSAVAPDQASLEPETAESLVQLDPQTALNGSFNRAGQRKVSTEQQEPGHIKDTKLFRERVRQKYRDKKQAEPSRKERVRSVTVDVWDAKNQLVRDFFVNEYGGKCQICDSTFPRRSDGIPYFEAVYLIPHSKAAWTDAPGSVVCLCAQCSAKWQHGAVECPDVINQLSELQTESEAGSKPRLKFQLVGNDVSIRFSDRHLVEVQELLNSASAVIPTGLNPKPEIPVPSQILGQKIQPGNMVACPKCSAMVRSDRLEKHLRKAHRTRMAFIPSTSVFTSQQKKTSIEFPGNRCRGCGKLPVPGSDYCYSCG